MKRGSGIVAAWMCAFSGFGLIGSVGVASAQVTLLGTNTRANGVSADGRVVVGEVGVGTTHAFVWTAAGGRNDFGLDPGMPQTSTANAVSGDGRYVVGGSFAGGYRWSGPGTFQTLGTLPFPIGGAPAYGVNGDGSVIAGWAGNTNTGPVGSFYWTQSGGMQQIPISIDIAPRVVGVSRDTGVAVGTAGLGDTRAFTWSPSAGTRVLQAPAGAPFQTTTAAAINFDGTIVVGTSSVGTTVWRNEVPSIIPQLPGFGFEPACLNDDASVIAGLGSRSGILYAVIWTQARGTELLTSYLASQGVSLPSGIFFQSVTGVSSDGRTIVGVGGFLGGAAQGFVVTVPAPATVALTGCLMAFVAQRRRRVFGAR